MRYISPLISDGRNKLGGTVWARNRSGIYQRALVQPSQPRTASQVANRADFATFAAAWKSITPTQRDGWNTIAPTLRKRDTLGQTYRPSGYSLFVSHQRYLSQAGLPAVYDAPGAPPAFPSLVPTTAIFQNVAGDLATFSIVPPSAVITQSQNLILSMTPPLSAGINFVARHLYRRITPPLATGGGDPPTQVGFFPSAPNANFTAGSAWFVTASPPSGAVVRISLQWRAGNTPPSSAKLIIASTVTGLATFTVLSTLTVANTTAQQHFIAGTDFAPFNISASQFLGLAPLGGNMPDVQVSESTNGLAYTPYVDGMPPAVVTPYNGTFAMTYEVQTGGTANQLLPADAYTSLFGVPPAGSRIGSRLQLIDPTTGYASAVASILNDVTGI